MTTERNRLTYGAAGLALAAALAIPFLGTRDLVTATFFTFLYIILALNYDILGGFLGYMNLGQGAFFGVAAYASVLLLNSGRLDPLGGADIPVAVALAVVLVLALLNFFGQRPVTSTAQNGDARLQVYAPAHARSGLVYAARFRIDALRTIKSPSLVLWPGWAEQYTVNGLAPQPVNEGSSNGRLDFGFDKIAAGRHLTFWISLQVNPTNVGRRTQRVTLYDGNTPLITVHRTITIFP
jgi:hypothetical protein